MSAAESPLCRILIVDDDPQTLKFLHAALDDRAEVVFARSGEEALLAMAQSKPDLVILDIEMPGIGGYATCRRIRETSTVPIIFITAHSSLEKHLEAFAAGGSDLLCKPLQRDLLRVKVDLALKAQEERAYLREASDAMSSVALSFLSTTEENGVLLKFLRAGVQCRSYEELAQYLLDAAQGLGIRCFGAIRHAEGEVPFGTEGAPGELQHDVLQQLSTMGRLFQFKRQLVVNYEHVSLVVTNLPLEFSHKENSLRDSVVALVESAEALCEHVRIRQESMARAEQLQVALVGSVSAVENLREKHGAVVMDTRLLLQELADKLEKSFSWLGTTNSQEREISDTVNGVINRIIHLLATKGRYDQDFDGVLDVMRGTSGSTEENNVDLW